MRSNVQTYRSWLVRMLTAVLMAHGSVLAAYAQTQPEYRLELGGGVGAVSYQGDFNSNITKNLQPMFTVLAKYRFNPRLSLAMNVSYGTLKGGSKDVKTYYSAPEHRDYSFKTNIVDVGWRVECNFWSYGTGEEYRGAKRVTPYIYIGLGVTGAKTDKTELSMNVPLGGGVKYKAGDRVNLALEWTMHFTGSDKLDGVEDPYGIKREGLFKNTDCYSHLRFSVTYDLWAKCRTCHNDKD